MTHDAVREAAERYERIELPLIALDIRKDGEWADFFARRFVTTNNDRTRYSVTWVTYSSFGCFGHHWYAMGEPFHEFIAGIEEDYLLSKIAKREICDKTMLRNVRREIFTSSASKDDKREAARAVRELADNYESHTLATMLYESAEVNKVHIEWCDITTQVWENAAVMFVRKLWPDIVAEVRTAAITLPGAK